MNPFARFNIDHLSPSSLNLYAANPSFWCCRYLLEMKDEAGPSASRGTAVESGLDSWLYERDIEKAIQIAYQNFAQNTGGVVDEDHDAERDNLEPMLRQAIAALKDVPAPNARQLRMEYWIDGIEIPVIGYTDYLWPERGRDLKTTKACPSSIKADHGRQVSLYSKAFERPYSVLYVTGKRWADHPLSPEDAEQYLRDVARQARAIRHLLRKSDSAQDAARFFAPERSAFHWNEKTHQFADGVYGAAQ